MVATVVAGAVAVAGAAVVACAAVVLLATGATHRTCDTIKISIEIDRGRENMGRTSPIPMLVHCALTFGLFVSRSPSEIPAAAAIAAQVSPDTTTWTVVQSWPTSPRQSVSPTKRLSHAASMIPLLTEANWKLGSTISMIWTKTTKGWYFTWRHSVEQKSCRRSLRAGRHRF